ncbi:MAG: sigma-70 family RNA polymerase sigma factor [Patescibacteria group bacterium]
MNQDPEPYVFNRDKGEETFDFYGTFTANSWTNNRHNYKLIAEALELWMPFSYAVEVLDIVNQFLSEDCEYIFDGTISNLKYLVNSKYLDIGSIQSNIYDAALLKELLLKYLEPTIEDLFDEVEGGHILRTVTLEHPNMFSYLEAIPQGEELKRKLPHNSDELRKLFGIDEFDNEIMPMNPDRWSPQAMRCKMVQIALNMKHGKLKLQKDSELVNVLTSITEHDIETVNEEKLVFINALWQSVASGHPWDSKATMTMQEVLTRDVLLISVEGSDLNVIYNTFLKDFTERIAKQYFEDFGEGHIALLAVLHAVVIVLYRTTDEIKPEYRHPTFRVDGFSNKFFEYIFTDDFKLQDWFVEYFSSEMDRRIGFIKLMHDNGIAIVQLGPRKRIYYLPLLESFRFIAGPVVVERFLPDLVKLFQNKTIPNDVKDDLLINMVFNTQKIVALGTDDEWEKEIKNAFMLFVLQVFRPKIMKTAGQESEAIKRNDLDYDDIKSQAHLEVLEMILKFDLSRSPTFIGYMSKMLRLETRSAVREKKADLKSVDIDDYSERLFSDDDLLEKLNDKQMLKAVNATLDNLPEKEREAIKKSYFKNKKLSEAERKARYRGIKKLKESLKDGE